MSVCQYRKCGWNPITRCIVPKSSKEYFKKGCPSTCYCHYPCEKRSGRIPFDHLNMRCCNEHLTLGRAPLRVQSCWKKLPYWRPSFEHPLCNCNLGWNPYLCKPCCKTPNQMKMQFQKLAEML